MNDAILISVQRPHTENIHKILKRKELRKTTPKTLIASHGLPITCFMYEPKKNGDCGAIVVLYQGGYLCLN